MVVVDGTLPASIETSPEEVAWLDDTVAPSAHRDVDGSRYGFYRLEQEAMDLAEAWATGAVARLREMRLLRSYEGVDLAPVVATWLYFQLRADAMAGVRLARVLDVEPLAPSRILVSSPVRAALFARVLQARGMPREILTLSTSPGRRVMQVAQPVARRARDLLRRCAVGRAAPRLDARSRLVFVSHHPVLRPRIRPVLAELIRRGWGVSVVNVESAAPADETLPVREMSYADYVPRGAAISRVFRYLTPLRRQLRASTIGDLPATIAFPAGTWTRVVTEALYTVISEIEIVGRILRDTGAHVLMYSNRSGFGPLLHGVATAHRVPSVLVQLTESFWDDDFRHCRADLFTAMGESARERLLKVGADPHRVVVTGSDHYFDDPGMDVVAAKVKVCADLGLAPMAPRDRLLLLVSQSREFLNPDPYRRFVYRSVLAALRELPGVRLVVKRHPRETDSVTHESFRVLPAPMCAVTSDYRLSVLLEAADAVVIMWSTVGLQAITRGRPVVVINYKGDGPVVPCAVEGAALSVETPAALADVLRSALYDEPLRADLRRRGAVFLDRYLSPNDGRAADRIADATEALCAHAGGRG